MFDPVGFLIGLVPLWLWWTLGVLAVIFIIGVIWRLKDVGILIHKIAGWPGVTAFIGLIFTALYLIWPKEQKHKTNNRTTSKPKLYPIPPPYDRYNGKRFKEGKHQKFNQVTGEWEDV